jgi:mono/diheme cytochrome c family protein
VVRPPPEDHSSTPPTAEPVTARPGRDGGRPSLIGIEAGDDEIADIIRNGVDQDDAFPAMGPVGALDDAEIAEVIAHLRTLQSGG